MRFVSVIVVALVFSLAGCISRDNAVIVPGTELRTAELILVNHGARKVEHAYLMPWGECVELTQDELGVMSGRFGQGQDAVQKSSVQPLNPARQGALGYHVYYHLANGTCIQLRVISSVNPPRVMEITASPTGVGYKGKLQWVEDLKSGKNRVIKKLSLEPFGIDA